jgi:hypothetical protein
MSSTIQLDFFLNKLDEDLELLYEDIPNLGSPDKAFGPWSLMLLENIPLEDAVESFVDGGGDKGLDVIYVPDEPGPLVILQSKRYRNTGRNLSKNDIVLALNGVRWLINGDISDPTVNPSFRAKASEFREALTSYFPRVDIYLVTTGQGPAEDGISEIDLFLDEANSPSEPVFSVMSIDVNELLARFRRSLQKTTPNEIILEFSKPRPFEHDTGRLRAIVGSVSAKVIAELFDKHGNAIFEANVRNYLGNVRINRQIEGTAIDADQAESFWFYNNGLSMICSQLSFRSQTETSRVRLVNAQIVNGCQTVHSLWHAYKAGKLQDDVEVLVRIVEQPDPEFVRLVTRYNNTQNAVRSADLMGRDPIQMRLQEEIERLGYYYETRRGDWRQYYNTREERIAKFGRDYTKRVINLKEAAQACAAFYLQQPVIAKNKTAILTTPVAEEGMYEEVFSESISGQRIIGAVILLRRITEKRKEILRTGMPPSLSRHEDWLPHADFHILSLFARQYFDPLKINTNVEIESFFAEVDDRFDDLFPRLIKKIGPFLQKRKREPGYSHPRFLKTEQSWQEIQSVIGRRSPIRLS